jgi:anthranilate phosphoribosyltransferase
VHGADGLDEVSIRTETHVWEAAGPAVRQFRWTPEQFGLARAANIDSMLVESAAESAAVIRNVVAGKPGPARDVVVLNAAAALWVAGKSDQPAECARLAAGAIDSGAARDLLERLTELSSP